MRLLRISILSAVLCACAGRSPLARLSPDQGPAAVSAAQLAYTHQPSPAAQLRLGEAQYRAGQDTAARATLRPLLDMSGDVGDRANLYDAAAADQLGALSDAHHGYAHWLATHDDGAVRARLTNLSRREADAAAREAIASERTLAASSLPARSVGVAPLVVSGGDSALAPLGYGLADLLITDLSRSAQLQIVDRVRVDALLRELTLAGSGRVDSATAPRIGRLVGARRIVNGVIDALPGGGIAVSTRVADAAQGTLVGQPVTERTSLNGILDSEKSLAFALFRELGVTLTPAERGAVEQQPTRYLSAFLAYSNGARAEAYGDYRSARTYYARAVMIDPGFAMAGARLQGVQTAGNRAPNAIPLTTAGIDPSLSTPSPVVDALNPSPASSLGTFSDHGDASQRAIIAGGIPGSLNIPVFVP
ncbi:MAG TPA: CsgG/HfaB family protein [Gemmatimonadaceae bacterium]|jgi:TolB-like protein